MPLAQVQEPLCERLSWSFSSILESVNVELKWWQKSVVLQDGSVGVSQHEVCPVHAGAVDARCHGHPQLAEGQHNTQAKSSTNQGSSFEVGPGLAQHYSDR